MNQKADHRSQFLPLPLAERNSQQDVFAARVAVEQRVERGRKDSEQTRLLAPAALAQSFGQGRVDAEALAGAAIGLHARARPIRRQLQQLGRAAQILLPEVQILSRTPLHRPAVAARPRSLRTGSASGSTAGGSPRADGAIGRRQFAPQNAFRGPVADHVMHHQDEHMLARTQAHQSRPDSRLGLELVRTPRLVDQQTLQFRLALLRAARRSGRFASSAAASFRGRSRWGPLCCYLDGGAQHLMPRDDQR